MTLDDFAFVPKKSFEVLQQQIEDHIDTWTLKEQVNQQFQEACSCGNVIFFKGDGSLTTEEHAHYALFKTNLENQIGDEIWGRFDLNERTEINKKWYGIRFLDRTSILDFVRGFSKNRQSVDGQRMFVIGDIVFGSWNSGMSFLEKVKGKAIPEVWKYTNWTSPINHPILKGYLEHYYFKLLQEHKIVRQGNQIAFNTGLLDEFFEDIYVVCEVDEGNSHPLLPRYINPTIYSKNERYMVNFDERPKIASFFNDISEVIYNSDLDIEFNNFHILDERSVRLPDAIRDFNKTQLQMLLRSAAEFAKKLAQRNYKFVIPQYWKKTRSIQFLMPIYLSGQFSGQPDCALVLERHSDRYLGTTILTLDMAYQNARLISKPDDFWLNP